MELEELLSLIDSMHAFNPVTYQYFHQLLEKRTIILNETITSNIVESVYIPLKEFEEDTVVACKHGNPCAVASSKTLEEGFDSVYESLGLKLLNSESINNSKSDGKGLGATSFEEIWDSKGEIVRSHGGVPVIKKIKYGAGNLYIILTTETDKVGETDFLNSLDSVNGDYRKMKLDKIKKNRLELGLD